MKKKMLTMLVVGTFVTGSNCVANAGMISGYLYDSISIDGTFAGAQIALQNLHNGNLDALVFDDAFSVDKINLNNSTGVSYGDFLSGGLTNPNGLSGLDAPWDTTSLALSTNSTTAAMFQFTGTAVFDSTFSINHDDGFVLTLTNYEGGAYTIDKSWPVSPTLDTFNIIGGQYNFILTYQAWNGVPEILQTSGVSPVPEPTTMLLFGTGIIGLAGLARRRNIKEI